ncbi:acyl-CoA carboxylase epsilon subunit [Streptomyces sp. MB09-01]|uniref:acyl-CoA carboxylase epsilon subunit n=1 Tax=Streptomyces sp. MB09-01 TaxID=3028666 RepID=UPI0029B64A9E|nr:acyl-CoA carboxylase epsilon subunit [Streptomyces sp. MB09-01]MDX3538893.1 acyl-CoA carboxylase epsilon subunit [Streptomyces sp. MB09-01]
MSERAEPDVKIVRGAPDGTELAAVLLALAAVARQPGDGGAQAAPPARADWGPVRGWRPPGAWTAPVSRAASHRKDTDRR